MKRTLVSFSLSVFIHLLVFTAFIYFLNLYREKTSVKKSIISVENIKIVPKKKPLPPKKSVIKEKPKPKLKPLKKPVIKKTKKKVLKKKHLSRQKRKEKTKKSLKSVVKKETDQNITTVLPLKVKYTPPPPPKESYISTNFAKIQRAVVQNRYYPKIAKRLHIQGEVKASFYLLPSGKIEDLKATGAKKILCKAAKKTILRASQDFPHPKERVKINIPIIYSLKIK